MSEQETTDNPIQPSYDHLSDSITTRQPQKRRVIRGEKVGPAFWTIASLISLGINIVLIIALVLLAKQLFSFKSLVEKQVLGGLYQNFVLMDQAHIRTTIPVSAQVPAKFDLPLNTTTEVTLAEDSTVPNATVYDLNAGALYISRANTSIVLPKGTKLPINLNLTVPVDQKIPVNLMVDVDIPLNQTELHTPFAGLQEVVKPYYTYLNRLPNSWQEALCGSNPSDLCQQLVR